MVPRDQCSKPINFQPDPFQAILYQNEHPPSQPFLYWVLKNQIINKPTCLYSGVILHSWLLGISTVPESWSLSFLVRIESLAISKKGERRASQLEVWILFLPALRTLVTAAPFYFYQLTWSPFLVLFPSPPFIKKSKKGKEKRKNSDLLRNQNPNHKSLQG